MNKGIDLTIDKCIMCKVTDTFIYAGQDATGLIFNNDVCIDCEERAEALMTQPERIQTLYRWTTGDKF